jgi:hypothetical protein
MKFKMILASFALVGCLTANAGSSLATGGSTSAGGGGGALSLASGFNAGKFDVALFGAKDGAVAPILAAFIAGGAVQGGNSVMDWYMVPGNDIDGITHNKSIIDPTDPEYFHLGFQIAYQDLLAVNIGVNDSFQGGMITFRGQLADALYAGVVHANGGAAPTGQQPFDGLYCEISNGVTPGTQCRITVNAPIGRKLWHATFLSHLA